MGAWEQAARCVVRPHVGDQTQQEQRPLLRPEVHEPAGVAGWLEARIDVPPGVPRILPAGESHDERTQIRAGLPGIRVDQLADSVEQERGVGCLSEAIPSRYTPDHRPSPSVRDCEVDAQLLGRRALTLHSQFRGKGGTNHEIALPDESLQFLRLQHPTILTAAQQGGLSAVDPDRGLPKDSGSLAGESNTVRSSPLPSSPASGIPHLGRVPSSCQRPPWPSARAEIEL